jgi:glucose/arabinose dehydrogenase
MLSLVGAQPSPPSFVTETVVANLFQPVMVAWAADGRLFVAEKHGLVRVVQDQLLLPTPFIDLKAETNYQVDRGIAGMALHPNFPNTPYLYLLYAYDPPGLPPDGVGARVARLLRITADPANPNVALPNSTVVLLGANSTPEYIGNESDFADASDPSCWRGDAPVEDCLPVDGPSHIGGGFAFGSDGSLYVGIGDGSNFGAVDPRSLRALNLDSLAGKVLRIDPLTGQGYSDNPFYDGDVTHNRSKVWSYGLRNPYRLAHDPASDQIFVGDVGGGRWEEINTGRGKNFGWPCYEGGAGESQLQPSYGQDALTASTCQALYDQGAEAVQAPFYAYSHFNQGAAIILGEIYQGTGWPAHFHGALFFADYVLNWIQYIKLDASGPPSAHEFLTGVSSARGIIQLLIGPDGSLYYLDYDSQGMGAVRRIRY